MPHLFPTRRSSELQIESRYHGELRYVHCDVAIDAEVEALVAAAVAHFGRLDIMFNNAGIQGDRAGFTEIEASSFDAMLRLLTGSVVSGHKYAARQFRKQNSGGAILTTTSAAGLLGRSEEHTSELQSLMRISYAVFCLKKKNTQ